MSEKKKIVRDYSGMSISDLKEMIQKDSGASRQAAKEAFKELEKRGEGNLGYSILILGGRKLGPDTMDIPKSKPKKAKNNKAEMAKGGMANGKLHMYAGGGSVTDNLKPMPTGSKGKGLRNLPDSVQMNMGFNPKS